MEAAAPIPPGKAQRGFFESLFDSRFDSLITPMLIRLLYVISMIVLAIVVFKIRDGVGDVARNTGRPGA